MGDEEVLTPPSKSVELEDPGVHKPNMPVGAFPESSDEGSDRFEDASEGQGHKKDKSRSSDHSPIPITRVERLDDEPAYGEVPGTDAYKKRAQDAVPDEVEVVSRSRSASRVNPSDIPTPKLDIPKIIAEKIDPDTPSHGEVPGTDAYEKRRADAIPDEIIKSPDTGRSPADSPSGSPTASVYRSPAEGASRAVSRLELASFVEDVSQSSIADDEQEAEGEDGFGDDFDDFEEGQETDDFGEFDDGFHADSAADEAPNQSSPPPIPLPSVPIIDWSEIDNTQELRAAITPQISQLFPQSDTASDLETPSPPSSTFLSDRSLSLYQQLVAPPPLAPPNWLRSRIRRLFLVSLGVPVDLDEILPASKQKKLILPSINLPDRSPRPSNDSLRRLKNDGSSVSADSRRSASARRRKDDVQEPPFDAPLARRLAQTTEIKLAGLEDAELKAHVQQLVQVEESGKAALVYWAQRKEGALKEKEAFEGVIENLVKHARKVRK